jgi:uncharacterized repeat protein (TIGR01451 family)
VNVPQVPSLSIVKAGTLDKTVVPPTDIVNVGDKINYNITVTNTGNVTLTGVSVTDPIIVTLAPNWPGTAGTLLPGQSATFTGSYTLTQADIDKGHRDNRANVTSNQSPSAHADVSMPVTWVPGIIIQKSGSLNLGANGIADAGDTISYTFTVTNTGTVSLTNVIVTDAKVTGISPASVATLAPAARATFTANYMITIADMNAGNVVNTATATGTPPSGPNLSNIGSTTVIIPRQPQTQIHIPAPIPPPKNIDTSSPYSLPDRLVTSTANMVVTNLNVQPTQAQAIQPVTIYANIANRGDESGSYTATLKINGQIEETRTGRVGGRTAVPLQFVVSKDKPGIYTVDINGQQASFTILGDGGNKFSTAAINWSLVGFILCSVIAIILLGLLIHRRFADY